MHCLEIKTTNWETTLDLRTSRIPFARNERSRKTKKLTLLRKAMLAKKVQDGHQNVGKQKIQKWILDLGAKGHVAEHVSRRTNRKDTFGQL